MADHGIGFGAWGGEFAGDQSGNGEVREGFVALTTGGNEQRITTDHGVVRGLIGAGLENTLP